MYTLYTHYQTFDGVKWNDHLKPFTVKSEAPYLLATLGVAIATIITSPPSHQYNYTNSAKTGISISTVSYSIITYQIMFYQRVFHSSRHSVPRPLKTVFYFRNGYRWEWWCAFVNIGDSLPSSSIFITSVCRSVVNICLLLFQFVPRMLVLVVAKRIFRDDCRQSSPKFILHRRMVMFLACISLFAHLLSVSIRLSSPFLAR